ncbi:DedA family protein [Pseudorhodoplanes sinuspersici]|uniref:DedA family protein n=1 Tax=Pseudorhodoplanes sinuspersici TaxID=1235591 RepID=A0A1W6ZXI3_9HYPH|nr:DedA family protein [Pseudorhodoplanes sinuspersici]ARQ02026.1 DedA family protein [Pseudorhodoplanes sinuspersici]RKE73811.1 membrane protein DedA with SNARE-associated domain [Pseudorhodoplanes sinuspersici]
MLGTLHEGWALIEPYIVSYGAIAIFFMIYFESFGAPVPGETGVIAAALLATKGELSIVPVYFAVLAGAILGDSTGYVIGRFGGRALLRKFGPYIKLTPDKLSEIENKFRKGGPWLVVIARFLPVMRQLNGLIAGSLAMPWHHFLMAQGTGAVLWTSVYCLGPYFFSEFFHHIRP